MHVDVATKQAVIQKLQEGLAKATAKYGQTFVMPRVEFNQRGTTAGTAHYDKWMVKFNPVLLMENKDKFIQRTVPHELAHLITDKVYPEAHRPQVSANMMFARSFRRPKREVHGPRWQSVMRVLGADPSRCHTYDVSNARVKKSGSYDYECPRCLKVFTLGPKRHAKAQRGAKYWHPGCSSSAYPLRLKQASATAAPVVKAATSTKPVEPKTGTKLEQCFEYYKKYAAMNADKELIIAVFVNEVGMTKAGASTYYYQCKKLYEQGV